MGSRCSFGLTNGVEADGEAECVGLLGDATHDVHRITSGEMVGAAFVIVEVVHEHVPDRDEQRMFDRDDCSLFAPSGSETVVAFAEVAVFGPGRAHRRVAQGGPKCLVTVTPAPWLFDPPRFVAARAYSGTRCQVRGGSKPGHVPAGLGDDHRSAFAVDTRDGHQVLDHVSERGEFGVDSRRQFIDPAQDDYAEERMVVIETPGLDQSIMFQPQLLFGQIGKDLWIPFTVDQGLHHRTASHTEDVGGYHGELHAGVFEDLLQSLCFPVAFPDRRRPTPGEITQTADRLGRY